MTEKQITEKEQALMFELHFMNGVRFPKMEKKETIVKGWNTLSAKEINRMAKERTRS